ncbi:hypothetical protein EVAR_87614_1 [Eumeta japonica]|uniref:Uncharacterized protein n=1 Tax=Eumeta variegata TaxID=151549 RepID=A0A4C1WI12_EUMVA|nr:hypothetical protein EVAR_87614_1 [Eumeta japonica]
MRASERHASLPLGMLFRALSIVYTTEHRQRSYLFSHNQRVELAEYYRVAEDSRRSRLDVDQREQYSSDVRITTYAVSSDDPALNTIVLCIP